MLVRIHKIESIRDVNGVLGKRIELIEDRNQTIVRAMKPQSEEVMIAQNVMQALQQQIPMFAMSVNVPIPKIILFLTEQEYESLDIKFDVNQTYEVTLKNQMMKFIEDSRVPSC